MQKKKKLVLFDFDGTLTKKDSLIEFTKFYVGKTNFYKKLISILPILILYKLKIIPNDKAKEIFFKHFFKGEKKDVFMQKSKEFALNEIDKMLNKKVYLKLKKYQQNGFDVYIISASIECYLKPWCEKEGINLISTRLLFENDLFTGKFATKNCYGKEKVNRLLKEVNISKYDEIHCYANSKSDKFIMDLATHKFWVKV